MEEVKKTRGAWVIHIREINTRRGTNAEYGKCSPSRSEGIPHFNGQENATNEREE